MAHRQPHRFLAALPRSPVQLRLRAQKDLWRGLEVSLVGALRLLPVARLYLALPLAVKPLPALTDSFSPLPTDSLTFLRNFGSLLKLR